MPLASRLARKPLCRMANNIPLDNLSGPGKALKAEAPDAAELAGLTRTGIARLTEAAT